ncbi:LLM class flavin-dependent oxidoreductase [Phytohabitans kaempferiae]|uniref:LLM class flavin-dependent oxidoreductase n=1 Tax=Phytohabitans kaempferiae TaxID=1620943 RepID=A0ABV6M0Y2_9ACTN
MSPTTSTPRGSGAAGPPDPASTPPAPASGDHPGGWAHRRAQLDSFSHRRHVVRTRPSHATTSTRSSSPSASPPSTCSPGGGCGCSPSASARCPARRAVGVDFASRGRRADEAIDLLRLLWSGGPEGVSFHGEFFDVDDLCCYPKPHGGGALPIHIGGSSRAAARRAGRRYGRSRPPAQDVRELASTARSRRSLTVCQVATASSK